MFAHHGILPICTLSILWLCKLSIGSNEFSSCLLDLRLTEVLRLKKSVDALREPHEFLNILHEQPGDSTNSTGHWPPSDSEADGQCDEQCGKPKAMALVGGGHDKEPEIARGYSTSYSSGGDYHHHPWKMDEKPSKLQTLFQISVTALAFLSFGGYLLCLIVQAIKSKGTTYFYPVASATAATMDGGVRRIKVYRRSRRELEKTHKMAYNYYTPVMV